MAEVLAHRPQGQRGTTQNGHPQKPEVKLIREKTGLSQNRFAMLIGVSKRTLENWEQGRRHPSGPAKVLLKILETEPEYAVRALHKSA